MSSLIAGFVFVIASSSCHNVVRVGNTQTASTSLPITKLHLPQPWLDEMEASYSIQQIEVRKVPNSPADQFFFRALPNGDNQYAHEVDQKMPKPRYGKNIFAVKFSSELEARVATPQEWESGARISTKPRRVFHKGQDYSSGEIEYRQKRYAKVGKNWGEGLLSPAGRWLAVFSYNGEKPPPGIFFGGGSPREGDVFWQIYDTVTGQKVFEWEAKNVEHPTQLDGPVVWLEDRYFMFPEGESAQNFIVVTLPPFIPEENPVSLQLPPRKDANGRPLPGGARDEVWIPLAPLTKAQAEKLTAPKDTEISEARLSTNELLLAINEETDGRRISRAQGDGAGIYHFRVINTYYYAVSLDNPTQTRFASKEEWGRARVVRIDRASSPNPPVGKTVKGTIPPYRQFAKSGTMWGSPAVLSAGEWIAILSYSNDAGARAAGTIFVDLYDQRLGHKLLSTTLPFTVSTEKLFQGAIWVEGGYIMLPLNASLDSFAFWRLPGGL
jgi:hypothetical protein